MVWKYRKPCYPILDEEEKVVGILTRYHLLRPRRKRVVLVDHNEASQSVPGLEEAEILEIIDHHRLADIQTTNPIYVRNEPVGSTNTILSCKDCKAIRCRYNCILRCSVYGGERKNS